MDHATRLYIHFNDYIEEMDIKRPNTWSESPNMTVEGNLTPSEHVLRLQVISWMIKVFGYSRGDSFEDGSDNSYHINSNFSYLQRSSKEKGRKIWDTETSSQ